MRRERDRAVLRLLPYFSAVARTGQVTAAADELQVPQPTVSRAIARLGEVIGRPVVVKSGRGVALTPAGERLLPYVDAALEQVSAGLAVLEHDAAVTAATARIAFQEIAGETVLPDLIRQFRNHYPAVRYELVQASRQDCIEAIRTSAADLALVSNPPEVDGLESVLLRIDALVLVVSPEDPLASRSSVQIEDLAERELIVLKNGYALRGEVEALFATIGRRPVVALEVQDFHTALGLAAAGVAASILPRTRATRPLRPVAEIPIDHVDAFRSIAGLLQREDAAPIVDALRAQLFAAAAASDLGRPGLIEA